MTDNGKALLWLTLFDFFTAKKYYDFSQYFNEPSILLSNFEETKDVLLKLVGETNLKKMEKLKGSLNDYIQSLNNENVTPITLFCENYPESLLALDNPPFVLFCKGDITLLNSNCIAIVGSRAPTAYGRVITQNFTKTLAENDFTIVSGLASGVDGIAHETALKCGGKTIAVLGGGFRTIYPAMHNNLAEEIAKKGLLVSEYRPAFKPQTFNFPLRNRIIAGLSKGVLITEAGAKSGALHTKEYALECGRDIFAVPGNITSENSEGTNRLLKSMQGALVTCPEDILTEYNIFVAKKKTKVKQLGINEDKIINLLKDSVLSFDILEEKTKLETKTLNSCLTTLQISGLIKKLPGNKYMFIGK